MMQHTKHSAAMRIAAVLLILTMLVPVGASAATVGTVQPRASYYLDSYNAYVYPAGNGLVQVWFKVIGVNYLDELGALTIKIYESTDNENWTWVKSFTHESTAGMLGYDDFYHSGHVDYQGVVGRYYMAYVCIWGGADGDGDTRYFWTSAKRAT